MARSTWVPVVVAVVAATWAVGIPVAAADVVGCGQTVTSDTRLASDLGPCSGDGLVVGADGITIDLDGHKITGASGSSGAGILLEGHSGVTVRSTHSGGVISSFSAGVAISGGSSNTVSKVKVELNAYGVVVYGSDTNTIVGNRILFNGTGVGVLGSLETATGSRGNVIDDNDVKFSSGIGILISPTGANAARQRMADNQVTDNLVKRNGDGIVSLSAAGATITHNAVLLNGGDGIQLGSVPGGLVETGALVQSNTVTASERDGISVTTASDNQVIDNIVHSGGGAGVYAVGIYGQPALRNEIRANEVDKNEGGGIVLAGHVRLSQVLDNVATRNQPFDLSDAGGCGDNTWSGNEWSGGTHPECVEAGGSPLP